MSSRVMNSLSKNEYYRGQNAYIQFFRTLMVSFRVILRTLFTEQTIVSSGVYLAHDVVLCNTYCPELFNTRSQVQYQIDIVG